MRIGDFAVEVVPSGSARVRELDSGHVLARPGTVYRLRLRNFGPLYCVAEVELDGRRVTSGGLVLRPWSFTDLERPIDEGEDGCFTVAAEGDETALGVDGGRDNDALGLIDARFRRELPRSDGRSDAASLRLADRVAHALRRLPISRAHRRVPVARDAVHLPGRHEQFERAAGTGLTGHSDQRFEPAFFGPLEPEATRIRLRLVIGSDAAIADAAPINAERAAPERPAARP